MGYYLLDNRGSREKNWYSTRRSSLRVIVMHITAGLEDLDTVNDHSAENTARYAATVTDRLVSWHAGADADSYLDLLPASYTAFHCRGYNSSTWGLEISKRNVKWAGMDPKWVEKTLRNAARAVVPVVRDYGIPLHLLSKAQVDAGQKGFTAHAFLDPSRRSDPGADFPWNRFFQMVREELGGVSTTQPKGIFMALSDEEQKELLEKTRNIHAELQIGLPEGSRLHRLHVQVHELWVRIFQNGQQG